MRITVGHVSRGQAELEAELSEELKAFNVDPAEGRLPDRSFRRALAALAARRQLALSRRGRASTAYVHYQHSTLAHYLHQAPAPAPRPAVHLPPVLPCGRRTQSLLCCQYNCRAQQWLKLLARMYMELGWGTEDTRRFMVNNIEIWEICGAPQLGAACCAVHGRCTVTMPAWPAARVRVWRSCGVQAATAAGQVEEAAATPPLQPGSNRRPRHIAQASSRHPPAADAGPGPASPGAPGDLRLQQSGLSPSGCRPS